MGSSIAKNPQFARIITKINRSNHLNKDKLSLNNIIYGFSTSRIILSLKGLVTVKQHKDTVA